MRSGPRQRGKVADSWALIFRSFFRCFFVEEAPPGSQKVLKKFPRGVPGATRRLSGRLFWSRVADLKRIPLATPLGSQGPPPWDPMGAPVGTMRPSLGTQDPLKNEEKPI